MFEDQERNKISSNCRLEKGLHKWLSEIETEYAVSPAKMFYFIKDLHYAANRLIEKTGPRSEPFANGIRQYYNWADDAKLLAEAKETRYGTPVDVEITNKFDDQQAILNASVKIRDVLQVYKNELDNRRSIGEISNKDRTLVETTHEDDAGIKEGTGEKVEANVGTLEEAHYDGPNNPQSTIQ